VPHLTPYYVDIEKAFSDNQQKCTVFGEFVICDYYNRYIVAYADISPAAPEGSS
jgi:hypothetical protein